MRVAYMPKIAVTIDGHTITVQPGHAELARVERDGYSAEDLQSKQVLGTLLLVFHCLHRLKRLGDPQVDGVDVPATFDEFLDLADLPADEQPDFDPVGKGSDPAPPTG